MPAPSEVWNRLSSTYGPELLNAIPEIDDLLLVDTKLKHYRAMKKIGPGHDTPGLSSISTAYRG